jgi:hypothetical protein
MMTPAQAGFGAGLTVRLALMGRNPEPLSNAVGSQQKAVGRRWKAEGRKQKAESRGQMLSILTPDT